jgi:hypothetical protein
MELSSFIGTAEWSEFERGYRTSQFTCRPVPPTGDRFRALWSDWELGAMQRFTCLPQDEGFRLFTRGRQVPREAYLDPRGSLREDSLQKLWASGVSLTMTRFEDYSNAALALQRSLETTLGAPIQINVYLTPGAGQGLGIHTDGHDVLVLQLQGAKTWEIYPGSEGIRTGDAPPTTKPVEILLERGGWLYVPKGLWHRVRNQAAEPSLHFTISLNPMTWGGLLERALERALSQEPALRQTFPPGVAVTPEKAASIGTLLHRFIEQPDNYYGQFRNLGVEVPRAHLGTGSSARRPPPDFRGAAAKWRSAPTGPS